MDKKLKKNIIIFVFLTLFILLLLFWFNFSKPGTYLNNENISLKSRSEINKIVKEQSKKYLKVSINNEIIDIDPSEFGIIVNTDKTLNNIIKYPGNKKLIIEFDENIFNGKIKELDKYNSHFVNSSIVFNDETQQFEITNSIDGNSINITKFKNDLIEYYSTNDNNLIIAEIVNIKPYIEDNEANTKAKEANSILNRNIVLNSINGEIPINSEIIRNWINIDNDLNISLKEDLIKDWISQITDRTNILIQNGSRRVDNNGNVLRIELENINGYEMKQDEVFESIVNSLNVNGDVIDIPYNVIAAVWDDKIVANGAENYIYPALPNEKWININLSNHSVEAFEGTNIVMSSPMISAGSSYENAVGEFSVYWKNPIQTMRGNNSDGSTYVTENVPWILYYYGGYALHGAPWRSSFGYDAGTSGSHGCINLPVSFANSLYNWAEEGTVVVSHY